MALVAVLWITSLLALMAVGIGSNGRTASRLAFNNIDNTKAKMAADAGVHQAIYDLLVTDPDQPWPSSGEKTRSFALATDRIQIQVRDEDGKIDLNGADLTFLQSLFRAVGLDGDLAVTLADRIGDFRDDDSEPNIFGAEDKEYRAAGRLRGAADRYFRDISELTHVLGVTNAVYERVSPHLTVYADAAGVDPLRASKTVRSALATLAPNGEEMLMAVERNGASQGDWPDEVSVALEDYLIPSRHLVFGIRSLGESEGGGRFIREATVALDEGSDNLPFIIYNWRHAHP